MTLVLPIRKLVTPIATLGTIAGSIAISLLAAAPALAARTPDYVPGKVVVAYTRSATPPLVVADEARAGVAQMGPDAAGSARSDASSAGGPWIAGITTSPRIVRVSRGETVDAAVARLRRQPGVAYAVPDYIAHVAGAWIPDDPGTTRTAGGWQRTQWNFLAPDGVDAPDAWANLIADHRPGGKGVVVAVLDTGIAYRRWGRYRESPDFAGTHFVDPYDFVAGNRYPLDRTGHGTLVAGTIAEATNNGTGLTGIAYGATIMPVRVLDASGAGDATTISQGIVYAVKHGAQVINLSLQFSVGVKRGDIPEIINAIRYAWDRGVVVVGAAGNDSADQLAYPARDSEVISVGATTADRCLADYSNSGAGIDLVAPGGGNDASLPGDPDCDPTANLPDIAQMTLLNAKQPWRFGYPGGYEGTSMAVPHVSAIAALVIASGVLGPHPTPNQIRTRLKTTAVPLGNPSPNRQYGYGLVNAAAATAPIPVPTPAPPTSTTPTPTTPTPTPA